MRQKWEKNIKKKKEEKEKMQGRRRRNLVSAGILGENISFNDNESLLDYLSKYNELSGKEYKTLSKTSLSVP